MRRLDDIRGPLFMAVASAVVVWLFLSGQLSLYIHPRYHLFSLVMAVIAVMATLGAIVLVFTTRRQARSRIVVSPAARGENLDAHPPGHALHHHHEDHPAEPTRLGSVVAMALSTAIAGATVVALVILPPATLSTQTAGNRAINESGLQSDPSVFDDALAASADTFASFTVREWAGILQQTSDPAFYQGKPVEVIGFVAEDPQNPGVFYLTRFVVSCCSVDAQPVGVPVSLANWRDAHPEDQWLKITGEFVGNPDTRQSHPIVLNPSEIVPVEPPNEPYLF